MRPTPSGSACANPRTYRTSRDPRRRGSLPQIAPNIFAFCRTRTIFSIAEVRARPRGRFDAREYADANACHRVTKSQKFQKSAAETACWTNKACDSVTLDAPFHDVLSRAQRRRVRSSLPLVGSVCAGDKVDRCSGTWWTHLFIMNRRVVFVVWPVDPVDNAQRCPQVHRSRFRLSAGRGWQSDASNNAR